MDAGSLLEQLRRIDPRIDTRELRPLDLHFLYRLVFGREPDAGGWSYWMGRVGEGLRVEEAVAAFLAAEESPARLLARPRLVETKRGFAIFVDPRDESVSGEILALGDYESDVSGFLERELAGMRGTFVDIGANIGWFLLLARRASPGLRIVGFEPNPDNVALVLRSLQHAGFADALVLPYAATDRSTFLGLNVAGSNGYVGVTGGRSTLVAGVRADDVLAAFDDIRLIKMDIEGHEPLALEGLARTLAKHRPTLVSEFHPVCLREHAGVEPLDYLRRLQSLGYALSVIEPDGRGREIACAAPEEVEKHWRRNNERLRRGGEVHIDIVARPA